MKNFFLAALLPWLCLAFLQAQDQPLPQKLRHLCEPLDKRQVSTGYLWDQSLCFASPDEYAGALDTFYGNPDVFGMFYGALRNSYVGQAGGGLPSPTVYLNRIKTPPSDGSIPLALMTMQFDQIRPDAVSSGLLTYDGAQLHDALGGLGLNLSPYQEDTIYVATPLSVQVSGLSPVFSFPSELWYSNLGSSPTVSLDAGDGSGWRSITPGGNLMAHYADGGSKVLRFRLQYPNRTRYASSKIVVSANDAWGAVSDRSGLTWPRDLYEAIPVTASKSYMGAAGQATMHIFYNTSNCNPAKRMLRPLIIIEGYEAAGVTESSYGRMFGLLDDIQWSASSGTTNNLTDYLHPAEYDLVYVDLANGSDWIQRNAFVVEEVIKKVNEMKAEAGSTEQNVIIGVSMGGVVGKYALLDMKANGPAHDTRLYITYDSPLRGANVPIGTQCMIKFIVDNLQDYADETISIPALDLIWDAIQAPTPRQLLLYHVNAESLYLGTNGEPINPEQIAFLAELDGLGTLDVRHVALSNGSGLGTLIENSLVAAQPFFSLAGEKLKCDEWPAGSGIIHCGEVNFKFIVSATGSNTNTTIFDGFIQKRTPSNFPLSESWVPEVFTKPYDVVPGGTNNLGLAPIGALVAGMISAGVTTTGAGLTAAQHCFIPSFSAVSAAQPANFTTVQACGAVGRCSLSETAEIASPFTGLAEFNQFHVALDSRIANVLIDELTTMSPPLPVRHLFLNPVLSTYYNAAISRHAPIPTLNIVSENGKLAINNTGKIAFATLNDPNAPFPSFEAFTACNAIVTVEKNAQLVLGSDDASKHGRLLVQAGTKVHIKAGGTLRVVSSGSAMILEPGSTLILDPGAIVILESPESKIRIEGKLIVNGDIKFSGKGYFEFAQGHSFELGPDADAFRLTGAGKSYRFIRLESTQLVVPDGKGLVLNQGAVENFNNGHVLLQAGAWTDNADVRFYGKAEYGIRAQNAGRITCFLCDFEPFDYPLHVAGAQGNSSVSIRFSNFSTIGKQIDIRNRGMVSFENCNLKAGKWADAALYFQDNFLNRIGDCNIEGEITGELDNDGADPLSLYPFYTKGVMSVGGWLTWMSNGNIRNFDAGIVNVPNPLEVKDEPTNVYMTDFATISNCTEGIVMDGDATTGLVVMDCARILNAKDCIFGTDVSLMIDPTLLQAQSGSKYLNPNTFGLLDDHGPVNGRYLNICYAEKTPPSPIPATHNYWGFNVGGILTADVNPAARMAVTRGGAAAPCSIVVPVNTAQLLDRYPTGCGSDNLCGPGGDCFSDCTLGIFVNDDLSVRSRFGQGMGYLKDELYEDARGAFSDVSSLWQPGLPEGYGNICQSLIHASRSLAPGAGEGLKGQGATERGNAARESALLLYPNPAGTEFRVFCDKADADVRVFDTYGRLMGEYKTQGEGARFEVSGWPRGMYRVELRSAGSREWGSVLLH